MNINKENYESYLLDHIEGNLSTGQTSQLFTFLDANPELKRELEAFEQTILVPDAAVVFPNKEALKKKEPKVFYINRTFITGLAVAATLALAFLLFRPAVENTGGSPEGGLSQGDMLALPSTGIAQEGKQQEGKQDDKTVDEAAELAIETTPESASPALTTAENPAEQDLQAESTQRSGLNGVANSIDHPQLGQPKRANKALQGTEKVLALTETPKQSPKQEEQLEKTNLVDQEVSYRALAAIEVLPATSVEHATLMPTIVEAAMADLPANLDEENPSWRGQLDQTINRGIENLWEGTLTAAATIADPLVESNDQARIIRFQVGKFSFYNRKIKKNAS